MIDKCAVQNVSEVKLPCEEVMISEKTLNIIEDCRCKSVDILFCVKIVMRIFKIFYYKNIKR